MIELGLVKVLYDRALYCPVTVKRGGVMSSHGKVMYGRV